VSATDDLGRLSTIDRAFSLNTTLAALSVRPAGGRARTIAFTLAHAAAYRVTVETRAGETLKTVAVGRAEAGRVAVRWGGRDGKGRVVPSGSYVVHIAATNELGLAALRTPLRIP
jgi:shikimate 5-dehydrogenase